MNRFFRGDGGILRIDVTKGRVWEVGLRARGQVVGRELECERSVNRRLGSRDLPVVPFGTKLSWGYSAPVIEGQGYCEDSWAWYNHGLWPFTL